MNRKQIAILVILVALILSTVLLIDNTVFRCAIRKFTGDDVFRATIQFSFVTMLGGAVFFYLNVAKDEEVSRELRNSIKMDLAKEIDMLYRSTKHIKRTLRSRSTLNEHTISIDKVFFEKSFDELDQIQIAVEQSRELIKARIDLFEKTRRNNISAALHYAARYLHDVFQDFEKNTVVRNNDEYSVSHLCVNIHDFLSSKSLPKPVYDQLVIMKKDISSNEEKWAAFNNIRKIRRTSNDHRRFKAIAEECFSLAATELRNG